MDRLQQLQPELVPRPTNAWLAFAGLNGCLAVALGAVGAHALADPAATALVAQASSYQLAHAVLLAALALSPHGRYAKILIALGLLLFCGSLYARGFLGWPATLAPIGGGALMLGWLAVAVAGYRRIRP